MDNLGLLNINIIFDSNLSNRLAFFHDISFLEKSCTGIFMNAFDFQKRKTINSINDLDVTMDTTYIIEYRIQNNNFFVELYKNNLSISFSKYLDTPLFIPLIPVFRKYGLISDFILLGFETSLFVDEYPNCINSILEDKSLYPLYVNQTKGNLSFKRYSGYKPIEKHIEEFLKSVFGSDFWII
uniref:hypothetical protein n=1 Tax=uncultured Dysgonomonas sp. TaxID=206096 RepID=UPI00263562D5|nr:hypothetical protein [uncultured Dysgonomonas sp.]